MAAHVRQWNRLCSRYFRIDSAMFSVIACRGVFPRIVSRSMCKNVALDDNTCVSKEISKKESGEHTDVKDEVQSRTTRPQENIQDSTVSIDSAEPSTSSFHSAFQKYTSDSFLNPAEPIKPDESFATMFRNSKFVDLGDAKGRVIIGKIYLTVGDDLYVDFGWKFPCVVQRPATNSELYVRNATVRLRINDLELSTIFLGSTTDLSLNEADCTLLGLVSSPMGRPKQVKKVL